MVGPPHAAIDATQMPEANKSESEERRRDGAVMGRDYPKVRIVVESARKGGLLEAYAEKGPHLPELGKNCGPLP